MAASRVASCKYIIRKYQFFLYISVFLVGMQLLLAYTFQDINQKETEEIQQWKKRTMLLQDKSYADDANNEARIPTFNTSHHHSSTNSTLDRRKRKLREIYQHLSTNKTSTSGLCEVKGKEALSAIQRATSHQCKYELTQVHCGLMNKTLYPSNLPRSCPLQEDNRGVHIGCYRDDKDHRLLDVNRVEFRESNSPSKCIYHCLRIGANYAGLEYGYECFCGRTALPETARINDSQCDMRCPGQPETTCGGHVALNIYHTGLGGAAVNPSPYVVPDVVDRSTVRLVFVLTVNGRALRQIKRLMKAIYHPRHYYYIHVDQRQDYLQRELQAMADSLPGDNVRLALTRFSTIWGGASLLAMQRQCMVDLLAMTDWHWDFFINLSESDYPIKSLSQLTAYLDNQRDRNFLRSHGKNTSKFISKQGLNMFFYECDTHMWRLGARDLPDGVRVDGGSDWFCINREFADYVVHSQDELVTGLAQYWTYSLLPAESFFHTVLQNSHFCTSWVNNNLHLTNWRRSQGCKCQYRHVVDWCGCSPNDFKPSDFTKIKSLEAKPTYFARKFEAIVNQQIIHDLDFYLFGGYPAGTPGLHAYWQSEYHHLDQLSPVTEPHLTLYHTFTHLATSHLSSPGCHLATRQLQEVTVYQLADQFQGLLVRFSVSVAGQTEGLVLETLYQQTNKMRVVKTQGPVIRLHSIQVGTNYDPKEEILRNYGNVLGPLSDLAVRFEWLPGQSATFTVAYEDPAGEVAGSYEVPVKEATGNFMQLHKPDFTKPLRPGMWSIKVLSTWELVAQTQFLVLPLTQHDGEPVMDVSVAQRLHDGPIGGRYTNKSFRHMRKSLVQTANHTVLEMEAAHNARLVGVQLKQWVESLVGGMWAVTRTCVSSAHKTCVNLVACENTDWSSLSPDPKSDPTQPHSTRTAS